jgi:predicted DNA-binding transcriptional regulator AlpA
LPDTPAFPETGFVRLPSIIKPDGPLPIGKTKWWDGVRKGEFPAPKKIGGATVWSAADIRALIQRIENQAAENEAPDARSDHRRRA